MASIEVAGEAASSTIDYARLRTVGLFVRDWLDTPVIIGSGVLYASKSGLGILTALHVVQAAERRKKGLDFAMPVLRSGERPIFVSLQGARVERPFVPELPDGGESLDLCFIRVSRSDWRNIPREACWVVRNEVALHGEVVSVGAFLVFGFPLDAMTLKVRPWRRQPFALSVITTRYDGTRGTWQPDLPGIDLDVHFDAPRSAKTWTGKKIGAPTPPGLSGCGIWTIPSHIESERPVLVAIEHQWNQVIRALRASRLAGLSEDLAPLDPQADALAS